MASTTQYFVVAYDNEASGPFTSESAISWSGGTGLIISVFDDGTTGKLHCALISGVIPTNNQALTSGATTADTNGPAPNGDSEYMLYPAYCREDLAVSAAGAVTWTGPALGATHSLFFDGQTSNVVAGEILTFSPGGQQCEVITVESDAGASGELSVRWITFLDTLQLPDDNDTFTGNIAGDGTLNGVVHQRCYSALHLHRFLSDLNDDPLFAGNDILSVYNAVPSARSTDQIVELRSTVTISDEVSRHMYGGSVDQGSGAVQYSGLAIQVTDKDDLTEPVVIQNDAIVTAYWANAYMPDSIVGKVRILLKTRSDGVNVDGKRVTGKLLRYGDTYFAGATTLGQAETALALFSSADGNNQTAEGTVAGAPYNTIVVTEGYQLIDFNNGNGAQPFGLKIDFGGASSAQTYERTKYVQREGTAETLFARNAQLFTGFTIDFAYDAESGAGFSEDETVAWGTVIPYTGGAGTPYTVGEVVTGGTSNARGRVLYQTDSAGVGTLVVAQDSGAVAFQNTETITGVTSGATSTSGTVTTNSASGTMVLYALDDNGTAGFLYGQRTRGVAPSDNQAIYGQTTLTTALVDAATSLSTRVINNQFVGNYTGSAYNPANYGVAIDPSDAIAADLFTDLLGATQQPPNNQQGTVTGGNAGDYLTVYPWDGSTLDVNGDPEPDFNEATLTATLTGGVSTTAQVTSIPINTPAAGYIRIQRDSDSEYDLVQYSSWTGTTYTLVGTAPSTATSGNNVFRAFLDKTWVTTGVPESYTAVQTGSNQVVIGLKRGGVNPIKPFTGTATFGTAGFTAAAQRISDA